MPTVDMTPDDTPPTGVPRPSQTPDSDAPDGVTLAGMSGTGSAPVAIGMASQAGTADAPVTIANGDLTPVNDPPGQVGGDPAGPDAAPPDPVAAGDFEPDNTAPGTTAIGRTRPTDTVPAPIGYSPVINAPTDESMHTPALIQTGKLIADSLFGFYRAPAAVAIIGVQLAIQTPAVGDDVIITLVDAEGVTLGRTATLPAGDAYAGVTFDLALPLLGGAVVRAKVTQVGSSTAGSYLTCNLIAQLT